MKRWLLLLILIPTFASAETLNITTFDQEKLASLLSSLPERVKTSSRKQISTPVPGYELKIKFPKVATTFQISCVSAYYNSSPHPSRSACVFEVDLQDPIFESSYDESMGVF